MICRGQYAYNVVAHGNKQVKEHGSSLLHFEFHGPTLLEVAPRTDDQGEILGSELGIRIWGVLICPASGSQNGRDLHPVAQTLLAEGQALELFKAVALCRAAERNQ